MFEQHGAFTTIWSFHCLISAFLTKHCVNLESLMTMNAFLTSKGINKTFIYIYFEACIDTTAHLIQPE